MLTWTGYGWLGAVFIFLVLIGSITLLGDDALHKPLPALVAVAMCFVPCYLIGRWLNRGLPPKFAVNPVRGGSEVGHTLALVRLEWASCYVVLVLAIAWLDQAGLFD